MARHRAPGEAASKRRVASWPIAILVIILLGAVAWVGWSWLGNEASRRDAAAAANCPGGTTTIQVATDPSIADTIGAESVRYTQSNPVVDDTCVKIRVTSINSAAADYAFLHGWDTNKLGPKPQAWIPDSSLWVNQALAAQPTLAGDTTQSIATSPVVLAMSPDAGRAMQAAPPSWTQLPSLVAQANGWGTFGQAAWGGVTLDLPDPAHDSASLLAMAEMIDPASPTGQPPISSQLLENTQTRQQIDTFASTQPNPAPTATRDALVALGRAAGVQTAPFTAVPTTEVALYQRNLGLDGASRASTVLDEVRVAGTTSVADFPFLPLAGDWVTSDQLTVAQHFRDFLRSAPEQAELSKAGLRSAEADGHPNPSPGMDWGLVSVAGTPTDNASYNLLVGAWNTAVTQSR
jgi:hypothetical protein